MIAVEHVRGWVIAVEHARDCSARVVVHQFHESEPNHGTLIYIDADDVPTLVSQLEVAAVAARAHLARLRDNGR